MRPGQSTDQQRRDLVGPAPASMSGLRPAQVAVCAVVGQEPARVAACSSTRPPPARDRHPGVRRWALRMLGWQAGDLVRATVQVVATTQWEAAQAGGAAGSRLGTSPAASGARGDHATTVRGASASTFIGTWPHGRASRRPPLQLLAEPEYALAQTAGRRLSVHLTFRTTATCLPADLQFGSDPGAECPRQGTCSGDYCRKVPTWVRTCRNDDLNRRDDRAGGSNDGSRD